MTRALFNQESYEVYCKYQASVHGEDKVNDVDGYTNFLCQVPLFDPKDKEESSREFTKENAKKPDEGRKLDVEGVWPEFRGGYHMLHRIDGELFAVGVLDYTKEALSSVYLFYDPKYEFLSPGNLCALKEIEYCRRIIKDFDSGFKFYYMGLYFQDC